MNSGPLRPVVKVSDMPDELLEEVVKHANEALNVCSNDREMAMHVKQAIAKPGQTWHCVTGRCFGAFVSHELKHFTYFYLGQQGFLVWKSS
eukprot:tig00021612_g22891.t1